MLKSISNVPVLEIYKNDSYLWISSISVFISPKMASLFSHTFLTPPNSTRHSL